MREISYDDATGELQEETNLLTHLFSALLLCISAKGMLYVFSPLERACFLYILLPESRELF